VQYITTLVKGDAEMKLSENEWVIMNALWEFSPATTRELYEMLPEDINWAYTTVKTMLTRLAAKNAVSEQKRGNTCFYEPILARSDAHQTVFAQLFDKVLNGTVGPLMHYLIEEKKLTKKEREELIRMLK
jgi:BlaI family transcriptional regulator, penicillinase repressor